MNVIAEKPFQETGKGPNVGKHEGSQTGKDVGGASDLKEVKYATTPVMSTYLLAFVVGPFEYIEAHTTGEHNGESVQVRVYALPGNKELGRHALNVCTKALEFFASVFGEPYPLPKMDMVAIPDFEAGAMENWGKDYINLFDCTNFDFLSMIFFLTNGFRRFGHLPYCGFAV